MGVAAHLGIRLDDYDEQIRTFIPGYEEMLDTATATVALLGAKRPRIVDLGTGTGALASKVLRACPGAQVTGIDADEGMLSVAHKRVRRGLKTMTGNFLDAPLPRCDAITASFSLHHVASSRDKGAIYKKCFAALSRGVLFVNADCALSSNTTLQARDRAGWHRHLAGTYGRTGAERYLRAWAKEDFYLTLDEERTLLTRAGFAVDVVWRHDSFAVIAAVK
jgi:ubiquinone/menaquinone biosynthesis C-methylase UbiE